jgi:L-fucose isomerase-like protein
VEIPKLQKLLKFICREGFEHHVAASFSETAPAIHEAAIRYLGFESHYHPELDD